MPTPKFVDHLVFRVADLNRTGQFYNALLGQSPERAEGSIMYQVGDCRLFFTRSTRQDAASFDKENIGFNHLAFGVRSLDELRSIQAQLDAAGLKHSGISKDRYGQKDFIWLDDPDGLRVEFYLRPL